jgi:hypothetical protein
MKRLINVTLLASGVALLIAAAGGCDDSSTRVPQAVLEQATRPATSTDKTPTTQELLTGHRSRTALMPLPVTMELPPGWGPMQKARLPNVIQGYTPSGDVQIQLSARPSMKDAELKAMINSAKKEMAARPQQIIKVDLRQAGEAQILERQRVGEPAKFKVFDSNNVPHESIESNFTWTIDVIVPHDGAYQMHELNFIGLTKSQYEKDKEFLNSVISTLAYASEAAAAATAATHPAVATQPAL